MVYITTHRMNVTATTSGGTSQAYYSDVISGHLEGLRYKRGTSGTTSSGLSTGAKVVFTCESGQALLTIATASNDSQFFYPRVLAQDTSGANLGITSAATPPGFPQLIPIGGERVKMEITSGGNTSNGGLRCTVDLYISGA